MAHSVHRSDLPSYYHVVSGRETLRNLEVVILVWIVTVGDSPFQAGPNPRAVTLETLNHHPSESSVVRERNLTRPAAMDGARSSHAMGSCSVVVEQPTFVSILL